MIQSMSTIEITPTRESDLDRKIEDLIGKMVSGKVSDDEKVMYKELVVERSGRMRPAVPKFRHNLHPLKLRAG
jgi:hypothetical protein